MNRRELIAGSAVVAVAGHWLRKCAAAAAQLTPTAPKVQRSEMPTVIGYDLVWRDTAGRIVFVQRGVS